MERHPDACIQHVNRPSLQTLYCVLYSQISIHPGNARRLDRARKGHEEPVRLPLVRVLAPHRLVRVARAQVKDRDGALGYRNFCDERAIRAPDGLVERQDGILGRTGGDECL